MCACPVLLRLVYILRKGLAGHKTRSKNQQKVSIGKEETELPFTGDVSTEKTQRNPQVNY